MAQDQLFGCQLDQIVQHAPAQGDLTYCDQMVAEKRSPKGLPTLLFPVLRGRLLTSCPRKSVFSSI